ncbi:MAG: 4'-phosphopantetheinyl transferase superfamily protein [Dysgonamonadaceae bacterium]|jgi:4'-phosphopantetheinyl transferase EntD
MLIRNQHIDENCILGIWEITESKEELLALYPKNLQQEAIKHIRKMKSEKRIIEWLSVRLMLSLLLNEEKMVYHKNNGQPYLMDNSYNISISHTNKYAAILLHRHKKVGIDIEEISERVHNVASKFISEDEFIDESQKSVHRLLHWSAKETLFKLMDVEEIDFKKHLRLDKFIPAKKGIITAQETKTNKKSRFNIFYEVHPTYVLTWSMQ